MINSVLKTLWYYIKLGPFCGATTPLAFAAVDFCQRDNWLFYVQPNVYSPTVVFPLLEEGNKNISESVAIANYIGLFKCPDHPIQSSEEKMNALMWSNKINSLWGRYFDEMFSPTMMKGYENTPKNTFYEKRIKPGTSRDINPMFPILSLAGGDHLDFFTKMLDHMFPKNVKFRFKLNVTDCT